MQTFAQMVIALVMATWIALITIFAVQNVTPVSLTFLMFESIQLPVGVLLSFCLSGGLILGSLFPLFARRPAPRRALDFDLDEEFDDL